MIEKGQNKLEARVEFQRSWADVVVREIVEQLVSRAIVDSFPWPAAGDRGIFERARTLGACQVVKKILAPSITIDRGL